MGAIMVTSVCGYPPDMASISNVRLLHTSALPACAGTLWQRFQPHNVVSHVKVVLIKASASESSAASASLHGLQTQHNT